ncbi:MAG: phosphoglycerate dehydrogenase [Saprospiraceae bacterium]|nr:phosphoglycerate dehydrogenase [Saprospiraceae bacterium]MCF8249286.1 phosphoglycerate dehydrogenase [Saprospiraceae bacterium]MCF8279707.1 phosphoglycerate dehydrogenase [Bacteroidales bacterium]MCF8311437.1 phosphoglycerate dehydrogenase [Saprospiraceae bacterium]MCF8439905.1 phosphoglycerate dehydrogenase [Saprospiraceae bacterium]
MKVLVTCPPMLRLIDEFRPTFESKGVQLVTPNVVQTLTEAELIDILPAVDGWIIGDDPATERVFQAGKNGHLKAAVKWGVGVDNVDFAACKKLGIPVINTPQMFGEEVGSLAVHYVIGLARQTFLIDRGVRAGQWPKPAGISLMGKTAALIGFGDIGKATARMLDVFGLNVNVYDPFASRTDEDEMKYRFYGFPTLIEEADFVIVTCSLTAETKHLINENTISKMKDGVRVVNVSRGGIVDETALVGGLVSGKIHSAALDVFDAEPLPEASPLRSFERCIFGTHNGSNTLDAVRRASQQAMKYMFGFLKLD